MTSRRDVAFRPATSTCPSLRIVLQLLGSPLSPNKPVDITFPRTAESTIELVDAYGAEGQREYNWYEAKPTRAAPFFILVGLMAHQV